MRVLRILRDHKINNSKYKQKREKEKEKEKNREIKIQKLMNKNKIKRKFTKCNQRNTILKKLMYKFR